MSRTKKMESRDRLLSLQEELNELLMELVAPQQERYMTRTRSMELPVDLFETADALHVRMEAPGIAREDVAVYLARDLLVIEGVKKSPYPGEKCSFLNVEREFGKFKREIGIPKPVDGRVLNARLVEGVLHVTMPKISDRRGKRTRITIE